MNIIHIILAHKNQPQLVRLINQIPHPDSSILIHVDKKSSAIDHKALSRLKNVHIVEKNISVKWGSYDIIQAMLNGLQAAVDLKEDFDYINILSGQDYPIQPVSNFINYLDANKGYEFIGNRPYDENIQNVIRFSRYHFSRFPIRENSYFERAFNKIVPKRKFPFDYTIRKGPNWMSLSRPAVEYILNFLKANKDFVRYHKWVHCPDEFFFQTILYNSPFRAKMRNQIFHYIDWSENKPHPKTLTIKDWEALDKAPQSPLFFARKFDTAVDSAILDKLDKKLAAFPAHPVLESEEIDIID